MKDNGAVINWLAGTLRSLVNRVDELELAAKEAKAAKQCRTKISIYGALIDVGDFHIVIDEKTNLEEDSRTSEAGGKAEKTKGDVKEAENRTSEAGGEAEKSKHHRQEKEKEQDDEDDEENDFLNEMFNAECDELMAEAAKKEMKNECEVEARRKDEQMQNLKEAKDEEDDEVEMANYFKEAEKKAEKTKRETGYKGPLCDMKREKSMYESEMKLNANPNTRDHIRRTSLLWGYYEEKKKRREEGKKNGKEDQDKMQEVLS